MMKSCCIFLFTLLCSTLHAQQADTITTAATLTKATVYYGYGAELQHHAKAALSNGVQQLVINDIALAPDLNTIQVGCPENVTILSWYHRAYTKPATVTPPGKEADSIRMLNRQIAATDN